MRAAWFVAGTAAGAYAATRVRRVAEALTVDGVHDRLTGWFAGARVLREELDAARRTKETELRSRLAVGRHGGPGGLPGAVADHGGRLPIEGEGTT